MDTFTLLSQFARSWAAVGMTVFYVLVVFWAFRPGSRRTHEEAASLIFRNDSKPADQSGADPATRANGATQGRAAAKGA